MSVRDRGDVHDRGRRDRGHGGVYVHDRDVRDRGHGHDVHAHTRDVNLHQRRVQGALLQLLGYR